MDRIKAFGIWLAITLIWLIPLIYSTGSIQAYITLNYNEVLSAVASNSIATHIEVIIKGFLYIMYQTIIIIWCNLIVILLKYLRIAQKQM